jgi:hypothetical protein
VDNLFIALESFFGAIKFIHADLAGHAQPVQKSAEAAA